MRTSATTPHQIGRHALTLFGRRLGRAAAVCAALAALIGSAGAAAAPPIAGTATQLPGTNGCTSQTGTGGACLDSDAVNYARGAAVSPDGAHVYVASYVSDAIVVFARDTATGALTETSCVSNTGAGGCADGTALNGAWDVTVSPDGDYVYAATAIDDSVVVFTRDHGTGALTHASCVSRSGHGGACVGDALIDNVRGVVASPDNQHVYAVAVNTDVAVGYLRVPGTASLVRVTCVSQTGTGGLRADGDALDAPRDVAITGDGLGVYVASYNSDAVVALSRAPGSGALTQIGCTSETGSGGACDDGVALDGARAMGASPDGKHVYVASYKSDAVVVFDRDAGTQAVSQHSCTSETGTGGACSDGNALNGALGVTVSPDGGAVAVGALISDAVSTFDRDAASGALAQVACISETGTGGACSDGVALNGTWDVTFSPDARHVYATSTVSDAIAAFEREFRPVCTAPSIPLLPGVSGAIPLSCTDGGGDVLTLSIVSQPLNGALDTIDQGAGAIGYTPNAAFVGNDAFSFTASDGTNSANVTSASIVVEAPPAPESPTTGSGAASVSEPIETTAPRPPRPRISARVLHRTADRGRTVRVRVKCRGGGAFCAGRIVLKTGQKLELTALRAEGQVAPSRRVLLARRAFFLKKGARATYEIRLSRRNAKTLFERADGALKAVIWVRNKEGGTRKVVRTLELSARPAASA